MGKEQLPFSAGRKASQLGGHGRHQRNHRPAHEHQASERRSPVPNLAQNDVGRGVTAQVGKTHSELSGAHRTALKDSYAALLLGYLPASMYSYLPMPFWESTKSSWKIEANRTSTRQSSVKSTGPRMFTPPGRGLRLLLCFLPQGIPTQRGDRLPVSGMERRRARGAPVCRIWHQHRETTNTNDN